MQHHRVVSEREWDYVVHGVHRERFLSQNVDGDRDDAVEHDLPNYYFWWELDGELFRFTSLAHWKGPGLTELMFVDSSTYDKWMAIVAEQQEQQ